jgi:DNA-binding transcriptional ArsR family regulator
MAYSKTDQFPIDSIRTARLAKALAHPARIVILQYLASQSSCICGDIVHELPLSQATVSQHLKALKEAGLINGEIDGPRVCYKLDEKNLQEAYQLLRILFRDIKCC